MIVNKINTAKSIRVAEASKLLENIYRSINIALINELNITCHHLNLNIYEIIDLASTKPFGANFFQDLEQVVTVFLLIQSIFLVIKKKGVNVKFIELSAKSIPTELSVVSNIKNN